MKKIIFVSSLLVFALILSACQKQVGTSNNTQSNQSENQTNNNSTVNSDQNASSSAQDITSKEGEPNQKCTDLKNQINVKINQANYCSTKEDCVEASFGCPFGCFTLVNKNFVQTALKQLVAEYQDSNCALSKCLYRCPSSPDENSLSCQNYKCVITEPQTNKPAK